MLYPPFPRKRASVENRKVRNRESGINHARKCLAVTHLYTFSEENIALQNQSVQAHRFD